MGPGDLSYSGGANTNTVIPELQTAAQGQQNTVLGIRGTRQMCQSSSWREVCLLSRSANESDSVSFQWAVQKQNGKF